MPVRDELGTEKQIALAIFAARESLDTLTSTLDSAIRAAGENAVIDVLVNGNTSLATGIDIYRQTRLANVCRDRVRIWSIRTADKANAWNQYFHKIWSGEELAFFCDGYVQLREDAIALLTEGMLTSTTALGGSGVPSTGTSARKVATVMTTSGGFHGNFCCVRGSVIAEIRTLGFRIPLGLYRTDSLVGAVLSLGLDPQKNRWDANRILVQPNATWSTPRKNPWEFREWIALIKRRIRQAKGTLENTALRDHLRIRKQPVNEIPRTANLLVSEWMNRCTKETKAVIRKNPISGLVVSSYAHTSEWLDNDLEARQVGSLGDISGR